MKIAVVLDQMLWGGIERVCVSYVKLMVEAGHQVDAYILREHTESIVDELKDLCNKVEIREFSWRMCPEVLWDMATPPKSQFFNVCRFAVYYSAYSLISMIGKPFVRKNDRYDLAIAFSGHIKDLTYVADRFIKAKHTMAWLHGTQYQYALLSPAYFRLYSKIGNLVCLSEVGDADCVKFNQMHGIAKRKIYNPCIVNKKEINDEKVASLRQKYGDFCLMVGRLDRDKDHETVILAMKYLKEKLGLNKKLVLVGDGPKRAALESIVESTGLYGDVIFEGTCSDVQNYYSAASVYVHGSPLEGLPTVFLEAMYFGLPVVSTEALAGGREILGNDEYGLLSPNWDPVGLAKNIERIYEDSDLREKLISKGRERLKSFEPETVYNQFESFLEEIMLSD